MKKKKRRRRYFGYCRLHDFDVERRVLERNGCFDNGCQHFEQNSDQYRRLTGRERLWNVGKG